MRLIIVKVMMFFVAFLIGSPVLAISFYGNNPTTPPAHAPALAQVISPEEFSNKVNAISQQTQAGLAQQANTLLPKQPVRPNAAGPAQNTPVIPETPASLPPPTNTVISAPANASSFYGSPASSPATSSSKSQFYTGFGTGIDTKNAAGNTPKTNTQKKPAPNIPKWNIRY